jgi:hypothetical protein
MAITNVAPDVIGAPKHRTTEYRLRPLRQNSAHKAKFFFVFWIAASGSLQSFVEA